MKKLSLFLTLALAMATIPVAAMQTTKTAKQAEFDAIIAEGKAKAARQNAGIFTKATVAAQGAKSAVAEFATDMLNIMTDGVYSLDTQVEPTVAPVAPAVSVKSRMLKYAVIGSTAAGLAYLHVASLVQPVAPIAPVVVPVVRQGDMFGALYQVLFA